MKKQSRKRPRRLESALPRLDTRGLNRSRPGPGPVAPLPAPPRLGELRSVLPLLTLDELETAELALTDREFRQAQRRWGTALTPAWARRWKVEPHDGRPPEADGPERRS